MLHHLLYLRAPTVVRPRAFHSVCLGVEWILKVSWRCPDCEKFGPRKLTADGQSLGVSRSVVFQKVGEVPEIDIGGCVICRAHDFSAATFNDRTVIYCDQCEKEFHVGCLWDRGMCDLKWRLKSESTFSVGGRVLDQYRNSLKPYVVEAIVCTRDWIYGGKENPNLGLDELIEDVMKMNDDSETVSAGNHIIESISSRIVM